MTMMKRSNPSLVSEIIAIVLFGFRNHNGDGFWTLLQIYISHNNFILFSLFVFFIGRNSTRRRRRSGFAIHHGGTIRRRPIGCFLPSYLQLILLVLNPSPGCCNGTWSKLIFSIPLESIGRDAEPHSTNAGKEHAQDKKERRPQLPGHVTGRGIRAIINTRNLIGILRQGIQDQAQ